MCKAKGLVLRARCFVPTAQCLVHILSATLAARRLARHEHAATPSNLKDITFPALQSIPSTTTPRILGERCTSGSRSTILIPAALPLHSCSSHAGGVAKRGQWDPAGRRRGAGGARLGDAQQPGLAGSRLQEGSSGLTNKLLTASLEAGGRKQALLL